MTVSECAAFLRGRDCFLILTHQRPDGDTVGSAGALCHCLRRLGKTAWLYPNPEITETYAEFAAPYLAPADYVPETVLAVDVAAENMFPRGFSGKAELSVDHHPSNSGFAGENTLCLPEKASCGEIVLQLIAELAGAPCREEADLLYVAVSTDTGCFLYGNTEADTHLAAAELIDAGADVKRLNKLLFRTVSMARLKLEGMIYTGLTQYREGQINVAKITLDMMARAGATEDDCDDLANLAGKVRGNRVAITVREQENGTCRASVRTDGSVDASAVCARFGGGGHKMAAGCTVETDVETLARALVEAVSAAWPT